jgi:putative SOS response-associated peptidase YedK
LDLTTTFASRCRLLAPLHDCMPVILSPEGYAAWLEHGNEDLAALAGLLAARPGPDMRAHAVGELVNNARNEDPRCIEPANSA